MIFCTKRLSVLFTVVLIAEVSAKPTNDFVFRDDDVNDNQPPITLEEENQILPSDKTKLLGGENEIVEQHLENGRFFQGDIVLIQEQKHFLLSNDSTPTRTGWIDEYYRWPKDKHGNAIMPYYVDPDSDYTTYQQTLLRLAMNDLEKYTCIRFVERTDEEDFVAISSGSGCHSHMGKIGGEQELSLKKNGCFNRWIIIHELIHAIGYDHMHSHSDRNNYIDIKWKNIRPDAVSNFDRVDPKKFSNFGTKYDLYSVMHYDKTSFSKNGEDTIVPKNRRYKNIIGQRVGLSIGDAKRINNMYKCSV